MNGLKLRPVDAWKSCFGLCVVCGTPMGLDSGRLVKKEGPATEAMSMDEEEVMRRIVDEEDNLNTLQENSIRVALFKYNLLASMQSLHVIDSYTMLKQRGGRKKKKDDDDTNAFLETLSENESVAMILPNIQGDLMEPRSPNEACEYDKGVVMSSRLVDARRVPGCMQCNAAMNRPIAHADITYRCFAPARAKVIPALVGSARDVTALKKVIQQVAFFFDEPSDANGKRWTLKSDHNITLDATLYRCVCNLALWGRSATPRFRMVAVFYGAWYIYHAKGLDAAMKQFVPWHMHVFRDFYMSQFKKPCTWFGMTCLEAACIFDLSKDEGDQWIDTVRSRLDACGDALIGHMQSKIKMDLVDQFQEAMMANVGNELSLFLFACHQQEDAMLGLKTVLGFFRYNIRDPMCTMLKLRVNAFMQEVSVIIRKLKKKGSSSSSAAFDLTKKRKGKRVAIEQEDDAV